MAKASTALPNQWVFSAIPLKRTAKARKSPGSVKLPNVKHQYLPKTFLPSLLVGKNLFSYHLDHYMPLHSRIKSCAGGKSVVFKNAASLSIELSEAKDNYALGKLEKRIQKVDLLIIDEMGYASFDRFQSELLFKVIVDRSEHKWFKIKRARGSLSS